MLLDTDDAMGIKGNEPFDEKFPQWRDRLIQLVVGLGRQVRDDQVKFDGRTGAMFVLFPSIKAFVYLDFMTEQAGEQVAYKTEICSQLTDEKQERRHFLDVGILFPCDVVVKIMS